MSDLISLVVVDQEPRVDSRVIASQLGVVHKNTRELIEQYETDLEEFGVCPFETAKPQKGSSGGQPAKYALLNENQSYLVLTYTQNTPQARELKKRLVRAFGEQYPAQTNPQAQPQPQNAVLAQQLSELLTGKVLVDYSTLRQVVCYVQALAVLFKRLEPLVLEIEQQSGRNLLGDLRPAPAPTPEPAPAPKCRLPRNTGGAV